MRKAVMGITALFLASLQSGNAETLTTAQDYAVDSDVVLESAVREVKSIPRDTANVIGDAVKMVTDEAATAANGVAAIFRADPVAGLEQNSALSIANAWNSANDVVFRSYKVSDAVGTELLAGRTAVPGEVVDVSGFFSGVEFQKGMSAMYRPEFRRLFVRQTTDNLLAIEDVLAAQHNTKRTLTGKQVEIQAKFVEVNQSTLDELGFKWGFDSKHGGAAKIFENLTLPAGQAIMADGLRNTAGAIGADSTAGELLLQKTGGSLNWSMVINALEQSDNSDVLSAPSVTTRDGKSASIWVGEQTMMPKSYTAKSANTSILIEHGDWNSELIGVQLEVTPELRKGGLIDLELKPKVMDFLGFDKFQVSPSNCNMFLVVRASSTSWINFAPFAQLASGLVPSAVTNFVPNANGRLMPRGSFEVPTMEGTLPYYRLREMSTQVTVADGTTVGMGGLTYDKIETYKDKVPVLGSIPLIGRLFRSEGEKSVKRNLMIFVTATEVDVNGRKASDLAMKK